MIVIGIDPSMTCSGISDGIRTELIKTKPSDEGSALCDLYRRVTTIATAYAEFTDGLQPTKFYIEAPMIGPMANHLYEVGFLMDEVCHAIPPECIVLVPPTTLKKFLTGKGNTKKKDVPAAALALHGVSFDKDPGIDKLHAWGLWKFGTEVEAGRSEFTPIARRGQGAAKVAKRNAAANRIARKANADGPVRKQSKRNVRVPVR